MACIDKTYVNYKQWEQGITFLENTKEKQLKDLGHLINPYIDRERMINDFDVDKMKESDNNIALWNTSYIEDIWLKQNCKLNFVQKRLKEQYSSFGGLFKHVDFSTTGINLVKIVLPNDQSIYFFEDGIEGSINVFDEEEEILVYGTTFLFKILHEVSYNIIKGYPSELVKEVVFIYYGIDILYSNGVYYIKKDGRKIKLENGFPFNMDELKLPKINYSFKQKDFKKYKAERIYFSSEDTVHNFTDFKNHKKYEGKDTWVCRFGLPNYIDNFIK